MTLVQLGPFFQTLHMGSHLSIPNKSQHTTQTQDKCRQNKTRELTEVTPWRDRAKASITGRAPDLLRSKSRKMDETVPAVSSALRTKESPSPSTSGHFLPNSSALKGGGSALYVGGLQIVMGITSNGGLAALLEESLAFTTKPERSYELGAL